MISLYHHHFFLTSNIVNSPVAKGLKRVKFTYPIESGSIAATVDMVCGTGRHPPGTKGISLAALIQITCNVITNHYLLECQIHSCNAKYSEASLIWNFHWSGHLFGNQFTFLTINWFTYPEIQFYTLSAGENFVDHARFSPHSQCWSLSLYLIYIIS